MKKAKLNETLKRLIEDKDLTLKEVSKGTGVPASTIGSYLHGKKAAYNPDHLLALAAFFNVSTDFLLLGNSANPTSLNEIPTEEFFSGWLRVRIERAIPDKKGGGSK
ncbi:MAG: helix-turn-helix domain-containing protein [Bdellovibrionales bacterium]|nr:helix-turn-helix domain-containing protein [Bdellovibrionales bacterium]